MVSHDILLGRWRSTLDLFGRVFCDDVGAEAGSVISDLGGFHVKETKFRREMERLRNAQQKDLSIEVKTFNLYPVIFLKGFHGYFLQRILRNNIKKLYFVFQVERDRSSLLIQTMKTLNTHYWRANTAGPPLEVHRVKVQFKDEPGEGSGVARSFYTAFAQVEPSLVLIFIMIYLQKFKKW